ncbi:hypothetical protein Ait01nite_072840 [Actinoplanes italicus]|uniref:Uncharacterized protein n=1 Tax=Actinoplanes italicus TaxID=113567 RepID=A0A2T0KBF9_9ACTN|nr:hypothetical protein [Actinoplanes italicus]PRX20229.1 hypothetical protein CLV67_10823 [Actinoplanes italicus]GIE34239.1 hypothetical protein Ait01nite_072840 [Actinoplanes italicus]
MAGASDNGGRPPGGGTPDDLPDFPEEWGVIVIPDDLSELADEVAAVRAELHTGPPLTRLQRLARRPSVRRLRRFGTLLVRTPALIISMAVLVTVASLFASAWPGPPRQPVTQRTSSTTATPIDKLPAIDLINTTDGEAVSVRGRLPAVVLLTEGCDCAKLITDTVAAARPGTTILVVSSIKPSTGATSSDVLPTARTPAADGKTLVFLHDQTDTLRDQLGIGPPDGTAAVAVVDTLGKIVRLHQRTASVETIRPDLSRL